MDSHAEMVWWVTAGIALFVAYLLAVVAIAHVIGRRRSPEGTVAWLLVILLLPVLGVPLYLLLGGRKLRRAVRRKGGLDLPLGDVLPR